MNKKLKAELLPLFENLDLTTSIRGSAMTKQTR